MHAVTKKIKIFIGVKTVAGKAMDYIGHRSISRLQSEMVSNWEEEKKVNADGRLHR